MATWYYDDGNGNAVGPFDDDQLRGLVTSGRVNLLTQVFRQGDTRWAPLSAVAVELGLATRAIPPPPPAFAPGPMPPPPPGYGYGASYAQDRPRSPNGRPLASWGRRLGAILLDWLIIWLPLNVLLRVLNLTSLSIRRITGANGHQTLHFHWGAGGLVFALGVPLLYFGLLNGAGQTIGKRVARVRVVDAERGTPIGPARGLGRYAFTQILSVVTCGLGGLLDHLAPLWDRRRRQAWHDKVVSSVVEEA